MKLSSLLNADLICTRVKAGTYEEAKSVLLRRFAQKTGVDLAPIQTALDEREALSSTVIAPGVGFPHARVETLTDFYILIGCFPGGVAAEGAVDPVRLVVLYLLPEGKSNLYLRAVSAMAKILSRPQALDDLVGAASADELIDWVKLTGVLVKDVVTAGDIMTSDLPVLRPTDSLRQAADLMVKHHADTIPVTEEDGTYCGVVTADHLLKIGLPDYLLQMESVGFLHDFEPFETLLKEEQSMTVAQIATDDMPKFMAHTPMIIVAGKLVRENAACAVVLEENKLAGMISSLDFVHKVVRA